MAGPSKRPDCLNQLLGNPETDCLKAANILLKIARNIQNNPGVEKYKSIQICGRTFMECLLPVEGAVQCLYEMGFAEADDRLVYTEGDKSGKLQNMKLLLEDITVKETQNRSPSDDKKKDLGGGKNDGNGSLPTPPNYSSERKTFQKLNTFFEDVLIYENEALQHQARCVIPVEDLAKKANERLAKYPVFVNGKSGKLMEYNDCLMIELLHWFKYEFFTWTDFPPCPRCPGAKSVATGMLTPTSEELKWGASRVEGYTCNKCGASLRFPRYNHPGKLLETRTGRCGEWANCFTLICRSLGYEARHVLDWTDHVWTEIFSNAAGRWIHCDPCENAFDKPLMYEQGWGKKLSLIVGASCDEITDVTWRYTDKFEDVLARRQPICRESVLQDILSKMMTSRQTILSPERKDILKRRMFLETIEFVSPKLKPSTKYEGRTTGSLEWRKARGEMGNHHSVIITPNPAEVETRKMQLQYFSCDDRYVRKSSPDAILGWQSLVNSFSFIERKIEQDWRMVYLARTPLSKNAHITWKFDFSPLKDGIVVKRITLMVESTVFQSGVIKWLLCTEKSALVVKNNMRHTLVDEVNGVTTLSLHAFLSGGDKENAWQHTQLFRESMDATNREPQFEITVEFCKD